MNMLVSICKKQYSQITFIKLQNVIYDDNYNAVNITKIKLENISYDNNHNAKSTF